MPLSLTFDDEDHQACVFRNRIVDYQPAPTLTLNLVHTDQGSVISL